MSSNQEISQQIIDELTCGNVENALGSPLFKKRNNQSGLKSLLKKDKSDAGVVSLTFGDFIYDLVRINPEALKGIDFASKEDLSNIFKFSVFAGDNYSDLISEGNVNRLQGYVAEQIAAGDMLRMGHDVGFAEAPNEPSWDIEIDGEYFNVKNPNSFRIIQEHFDKYPDIPVITNHEMYEIARQKGVENVYTSPNMNYEKIIDTTDNTIEAGDETADFEIPLISFAVEGAYNLYALYKGKTNFSNAIGNTIRDAGSRTIGGIAGGKIISVAGLAFGPAGGLIGEMAGAILGSVFAKRFAKLFIKDKEVMKHKNSLVENVLKLFKTVIISGRKKKNVWQDKKNVIENSFDKTKNKPINIIKEYILNKKFKDDYNYFTHKLDKIERKLENGIYINNSRDFYKEIQDSIKLVMQSWVHPANYQDEIKSIFTLINEINIKLEKKGLFKSKSIKPVEIKTDKAGYSSKYTINSALIQKIKSKDEQVYLNVSKIFERLEKCDYEIAFILMRKVIERVVKEILKRNKINFSPKGPLYENITKLKALEEISTNEITLLNFLRKISNTYAHDTDLRTPDKNFAFNVFSIFENLLEQLINLI